ncbi:hypothetical protein GCM10023324_50640 [Streptomyces youssoufiensis]
MVYASFPYSHEITGANSATAKKNNTTRAATTPARSRRKRRHINCRGERPTNSAATTGSLGPLAFVTRPGPGGTPPAAGSGPAAAAWNGLVIA